MGKYAPLGEFLRNHTTSEVPMSFRDIERIIGTALPVSSKYPAWWSNNASNNVMTEVWLEAGFQTEKVDIPNRKLVFRRTTPNRIDGLSTKPPDAAQGWSGITADIRSTVLSQAS